jgi:hypothetical protein
VARGEIVRGSSRVWLSVEGVRLHAPSRRLGRQDSGSFGLQRRMSPYANRHRTLVSSRLQAEDASMTTGFDAGSTSRQS